MEIIKELIDESIEAHKELINNIQDIQKAFDIIQHSLQNNKKILICGNGGSAAESQHFSAELIGKFEKERPSIPCISLTTDTSNLTSISNDTGFEHVFSRQLEGLGNEGDILIVLTTSDYNEVHSLNLKNVIEKAKEKNMKTILLGSIKSEKIGELVDLAIKVNHKNTARIQECHLLILHILAKLIEDY